MILLVLKPYVKTNTNIFSRISEGRIGLGLGLGLAFSFLVTGATAG
jgi:hypothetical protein